MRYAATFALLMLFMLPACDSGGGETPSISGEWSGDMVDPSNGSGISMNYVLSTNSDEVTGNGSINIAGGTASMDISGTYKYPDVDLTFSVEAPDPDLEGFDIDFDGEMREGGDVMEGTIQAEGATEEGDVRFVRE